MVKKFFDLSILETSFKADSNQTTISCKWNFCPATTHERRRFSPIFAFCYILIKIKHKYFLYNILTLLLTVASNYYNNYVKVDWQNLGQKRNIVWILCWLFFSYFFLSGKKIKVLL